MKVSELIEKLNRLDPDLPVLTHGSDESNFYDISDPVVCKLARYRRSSVTGDCYIDEYSEVYGKPVETFEAVVIIDF